jgi:sugar lactone lactonase YvrE
MESQDIQIRAVNPTIGVAGGEVGIQGSGFHPGLPGSIKVLCGEIDAHIVSASEEFVIIQLPESPNALGITLRVGNKSSALFPFSFAGKLATGLHPVTNPVIAPDGTIITTISGNRGQQTPQPLVRVTQSGEKLPFTCEIMNPTGLAFGPDGQLYVSSRAEGVIFRYRDFQSLEVVADELGVPCGLVFNSKGYLFVGDRSGKIYQLDLSNGKREFATLPPSVSAYHLAIDAQDQLYVSGPTLATRDMLYRITPDGRVETLLQGLGRPQGMAALSDGTLLLAATYAGSKGVFRISTREGKIEHYIAAPTLVGVAVSGGDVVLADNSSVYRVRLGVPSSKPS